MDLKIYDKQGIVRMTVSPDNSSQWNHEVGGENVVTVNFTTWELLVLEVGWYILVEGQRFSIKSEYRPKHIHDTKYTYNLKFYGREHDAQDILFCRLNQGEDDLESVFAYDGTPMDFLQKVVSNMNRNTDGMVWKAGEAISANRQTINFNGLYCWDALGEIARTFGTEWWMDGEYVNLNKCIRGEYVSLGYGQGLKSGLTQNENTNAVKWFTRLIPVGSSKNIDKSKYGYANLQLPGREKYIDINTQYGLKEYREEAAFSEIYPHRVGTISSVRSEERTNEETGNYTVYYVKDSSLPFNPDEYMISGEVIHMTFNSGALAGKDFEVNWNNETKEFEIINQYPDENTQLPGGNLVPSVDDTYVLWNISMPDEYIRAAEKELKEAVDAYLSEYSKDISVYSGSTDYIYISKNNVPLLLGQRIRLISEQYFDEGIRESRITRVSRKLNNLGEASIDCSDAIGYSWVSGIKSSVNSTIVNQGSLKGKTEELEKDVSTLNKTSKFWELKESPNGSKYLFSKLPLATQYGITMYANGGDMNIPSVYDGLPIDWKTLIRDENGVLMVNPDIEFGGGASSWGELEGKPDWITNTKPIYEYSEIKGTPDLSKYALSEDLKKYVSLDGNETINGLKNFTKGLQIDGLGITKSQDDVIYLDANLVVRGGITMYGTSSVDVPTIMDAIATDNVNLKVVDGVLTYVGASGGLSEVHWDDVIGRPTLLSSFTNDVGYIDQKGEYSLSPAIGIGDISIPAAGSFDYSTSATANGSLNDKRSFIGSVYNETIGIWYNLISVRHRNGASDGDKFGLYIMSRMDGSGDLEWNVQTNGEWRGGRIILDSVNWSQFVTAADGGRYLPLSGGTLTGSISLNAGAAIVDNSTVNRYYMLGYDTGSGRMLVGTPEKVLSIRCQEFAYLNDNVFFRSNQGNPYIGFIHGGYSWYLQAYNNNYIYIGAGSANSLRIDASGNILTPGGITMYSDIRKKTKLQDVELTLQQIADAPLIEHYYNSDENKTTHVGSIAQYWAGLNDWFCKLDGEGFYMMEIQNAALASAISIARELVKYESKTDKKIRLLKKRIGELEDKIEELEKKGV